MRPQTREENKKTKEMYFKLSREKKSKREKEREKEREREREGKKEREKERKKERERECSSISMIRTTAVQPSAVARLTPPFTSLTRR